MKTAERPADDARWLSEYFERYRKSIFQPEIHSQLLEFRDLLCAASANRNKAIFAGNGGSAAIASHCAVDFTKQAGIRSVNFNEVDLITCFSNDYGYELWVRKALEFYGDAGDVVVLISSSGKSPNIVNAAEYAPAAGMKLVTFTGFAENNPVRKMGQLNFWVNSRAYNVVEMTHHIWLLSVCDLIIGSAEY
jgi:D-sedoheptulose 7-phosphate isomerase